MFRNRVVLALVFGAGITALLLTTIGITWIVGIMLLSPGIRLASLLSNGWVSPAVMFVANTIVYSVPCYLLAIPLLRAGRSTFRVFSVSAVTTAAVVFVGWIGTREFEKRGLGMCGNEEVSRSVSPDGVHTVIVFIRNCGPVGGESTQVLLARQNRKLNHLDTGNVFITDEWGSITADWGSSNSITVSYPDGARITRKQTSVDGVSIRYEIH